MPLLFDEIKAFLVREKLNTFISEHPHVLAVSTRYPWDRIGWVCMEIDIDFDC